MQRLVPMILDAWRAAERELQAAMLNPDASARLAERVHVLQAAHRMAIDHDANAVVRFLEEHGVDDVVAGWRDKPQPSER